jgi:hypothetical protein
MFMVTSEVVGRPSVVGDDLFQSVVQKICERQCFTLSGRPLQYSSNRHAAAHIPTLLKHFNWGLFDHRPCSPDLAPSDYHLFTQAHKNLFPNMTSASIPAVTSLRSMYIFFVYIIFFITCLVNSSLEVTFRVALVYTKKCMHPQNAHMASSTVRISSGTLLGTILSVY